ncbi:MAG: hypothetical protein QNJ07_06360 [Woeseiaceae bacterium]|nr:hypothetical protein [Woeseiaceae bacterium]
MYWPTGISQTKKVLLSGPYWLGIVADALWAVALFVPAVFGALTGNPDFDPSLDFRLTMAIGGILMAGWTILLVWAVRRPIERRFVILLTAFPVVFGLFVIALVRVLEGNTFQVWILIKTAVLFVLMIGSFVLAEKIDRDRSSSD